MSPRLPLLLLGFVLACQSPEEFHRFTGNGRPPVGTGGSVVDGSGGFAAGTGGITATGGHSGSGGVPAGTGGGVVSGSGGNTDTGGPCVPTKTATLPYDFQSVGTGALCIKVTGTFTGWGCYNMADRTIKVNGTTLTGGCDQTNYPKTSTTYIEISAGQNDYASTNGW